MQNAIEKMPLFVEKNFIFISIIFFVVITFLITHLSFECRSALKRALIDKAGLIIGILIGIITASLLRLVL